MKQKSHSCGFEAILQALARQNLFIYKNSSNYVFTYMEMFSSRIDIAICWIGGIYVTNEVIEGAQQTLRERPLKFLTVGLGSTQRRERCGAVPGCLTKSPSKLETLPTIL